MRKEIEKHHIIRVNNFDSLRLFFNNVCFGLCCKMCFSKVDKFSKLYEKGEERIEKQLDVIKLIHNLQKIKILMKNSLMSPEIEHQMLHSEKFLIDLDNTDSESNDDDVDESEDSFTEDSQITN